jgi:hypothetical protein
MLNADHAAMRRLHAAGARTPPARSAVDLDARIAELARSVKTLDVMLPAADLPATLAWYRALGFELTGQREADGALDWVALALEGVHVMRVPGAGGGAERASLWLRTSQLDELHSLFE